MRVSQIGTPVSPSNGQHAELGYDDGGADGCSDFLRRLNPKTDMPFRVPNDDDGLESCALTGARLLLDRFDLDTRRACQHVFTKLNE